MDNDDLYSSNTYCQENERLAKKIIDFLAWTVIGLGIIMLLPKDPGFEETWLKGLYGLWALSFLGLYWTRHLYVLLWKMIKFLVEKVF